MKRDEFEVTRRSLVDRLTNWSDQRTWQTFFETYWRLIYAVARGAGLSDAEAQEVVQETVITVARKADSLRYDPDRGSFKSWLLQVTRWRIIDQIRKRQPAGPDRTPRDDGTRRTSTVDQVPDPAGAALETSWAREWQANLLHAALARLKRKVDPKQYQIFDCYVLKEWPATKVASTLGVNIGLVYLVKHRLAALLKQDLKAVSAGDP